MTIRLEKRLRVLAVDDEAIVLSTFVRNFRTHYDIRTAKGGEEALLLIVEETPDVLVSDYAMPGMNGLELLAKVAALRPAMTRVLSTAHAGSPEVVAAGEKALFHALVEKPWTRSVMLEAVEAALAAQR